MQPLVGMFTGLVNDFKDSGLKFNYKHDKNLKELFAIVMVVHMYMVNLAEAKCFMMQNCNLLKLL